MKYYCKSADYFGYWEHHIRFSDIRTVKSREHGTELPDMSVIRRTVRFWPLRAAFFPGNSYGTFAEQKIRSTFRYAEGTPDFYL